MSPMLAGGEAGRSAGWTPRPLPLGRLRSFPVDAAARTEALAIGPDAQVELPAVAVHAGVSGEVRGQLQRQVRQLRAADGDDLRPGCDQSSLYGALAWVAAGAGGCPYARRRAALGARDRGGRSPCPPQSDAAAIPRRADAVL